MTDDIAEDPAMVALINAARAPFLDSLVSFDYPMPNTNLPLVEPIDLLVTNSPIMLNGRGEQTEILMDEVLSVASCVRPFDKPGVLCSDEGFTDVEPLFDPAGEEWTPLQFLKGKLQESSPQNHTGSASDLSKTPIWTTADFIQALHH